MDSETESLYSFEFYIENVRDFHIECFVPSIAFRLLDFPVVQLNILDNKDLQNLSHKGPSRSDFQNLSAKLRDRNGTFKFRKGKSCLFKMKGVTLYKGLDQLPVQIFLFDESKGPNCLLGTALLPINDEIQSKIDGLHSQKDNSAPVSFGRKEKIGLYNLMGSKVATIDIVWNLNDYGCSVTKHLLTHQDHRLPSKIVVKTSFKESEEKQRFFKPNNGETFHGQGKRKGNNTSRQDIDTRTKSHKKQVNFKVLQYDYEEKSNKDSATTEQRLENKQENEGRKVSGSPDLVSYDPPLFGVIRPPPLLFCSTSKDTFHKKKAGLEYWERKIAKDQILEPSTEDIYHEVLVPSEKKGLFNIKTDQMVEIKHSSCQTEENHGKTPGHRSNGVFMKHMPDMPILMALMGDILKFYNASINEVIPNAHDSKNGEAPSMRNSIRKASPRCRKPMAKNAPSKQKSQFHKECVSAHDGMANQAKRGKVKTSLFSKGQGHVHKKEKDLPFYESTKTHKLRVEHIKKGFGTKHEIPHSTEEHSGTSGCTPVKNSQHVLFHKPQTTNELLKTRTIANKEQQNRATNAKPQWSSTEFEEHDTRMRSNELVHERLPNQRKQGQAIGIYRSPGHPDLARVAGGDIASPRGFTSKDSLGLATKSTFSTITSGDLEAWSSTDSQPHERASAECYKTRLQNDSTDNALHNESPSNTHEENEIRDEGTECLKSRTYSPDDAYLIDSREQKESRASWDDGHVWTDAESESHGYQDPLPSTYSPEASRSTRRKTRPLAESDVDNENEASSVWSSHNVEGGNEGNNNRTSTSPRSVDIEELYSDDFEETNEIETSSALPRKST